jgi:hypothetical protein
MKTRTTPLAALALSGAALLLLGAGGIAPPARQAHDGHSHGGTFAGDSSKGGTAAPAPAEDWTQGKAMTVVGEVMDPACYLEAGQKSLGPGHFQCAVDCARSGQTLAILDRVNDRIYFIAGELPGKNPNDPVMRYIHKRVDVRGKVYHRSGAWGIVITSVSLHSAAGAAPGGSGKTKGAAP